MFALSQNLAANSYTTPAGSFTADESLQDKPTKPESSIKPELKPSAINEIRACRYETAIANLEQKIEQLNSEKQWDRQRIQDLEQGQTLIKIHIACISVGIVSGVVFLFYQTGIIK